MWGTLATPAAAADATNVNYRGYSGYDGPSLNIHPAAGTGGLYLRDAQGHIKGLMGQKDVAGVFGCHPNDPTLAWVVQLTHGNGGWGVDAGYVRYAFARTDDNTPIPCGG